MELPCIVWTIFEGDSAVYAAIKAGALGYLLKGTSVRELEAALRLYEEGGVPMSPRIARQLLRDLAVAGEPGAAPAHEETEAEPAKGLSPREVIVLRAIAAGHSHKEVGVQLGISQHTVHTHLKRIYRKLHVMGRHEALQRARKLGIVPRE